MIALAADCILLRRENGECEPMSSQAISIEVISEGESPFDEEFVKEASAAVLHYFKKEQGRQSITLGEFAEALEKVLTGFALSVEEVVKDAAGSVVEADLQELVPADVELELTFFSRLRDELRGHLQMAPARVRFYGLRNCVKRLARSRRWTGKCRRLEEQIVGFLRECLVAESADRCALVVE